MIQTFLGTVLAKNFNINSCSKIILYICDKVKWVTIFIQDTFNIFISQWNFTKFEHKLKHQNDNDLIKPVL